MHPDEVEKLPYSRYTAYLIQTFNIGSLMAGGKFEKETAIDKHNRVKKAVLKKEKELNG